MRTDQDYNTSSKTPEQVKAAFKEFQKATAASAVERAVNELMARYHPVAKMIRKGREAGRGQN